MTERMIKAVAFDIIETTVSLEPMRERLMGLGLPGHSLELWFASSLRDAFGLAASDRFQPFKDVLDAVLADMLEQSGLAGSAEKRAEVLKGMAELPAHEDARSAFERLSEAGVRIFALSNGAAAVTSSLLQRCSLSNFVDRVISVDEVRWSKPRAEVYRHAVEIAGLRPEEMMLVACHPWDVHGAKAAGLLAGYVNRGHRFPTTMLQPDVESGSLLQIAEDILTLGK
jgi:2-haloacid dehalogenase